jgi:hypothetical protein
MKSLKRLTLILLTLILVGLTGCKLNDPTLENNNAPTVGGNSTFSLGLEYTEYLTGYAVSGIGTCTDINVTIPQFYNEKPILSINENAFNGNDLIETISIPSTVIEIKRASFYNAVKLRLVLFRGNAEIKRINDYAFSGCVNMDSFNIPCSLEEIGSYAFSGCIKLNSVTFDSGSKLNRINSYAFENCVILTGMIIPKTTKYIHETAFVGCKNLITSK